MEQGKLPEGRAKNRKTLTGEYLLREMAKIVSEIQTINIWTDDARTNRIARVRYQKFQSRLRRLVEAHKKLTKEYEAPTKEINSCTNRSLAMKT